ncbi:oligosaccharide flippase family protein [Macrococcus armenti]|uniref:lipopolysaccharide biosynthesis protein n=1 Tax=Macrococcus armenti TaxID=2875764 RepID=UPI001CCAC907|nr:oligosaccharide flippase family protein [Macrococcus armenti]UBH23096.1 oligosaccharide flippase family protein [Macrococcus armenti]
MQKQKITNIINFNKLTNSTIALMIGIFGGQLINLIAMPLITRIYSPTDVGIFSLILSYSSILVIFMTLYLEKAIVISNDNNERKSISKLILFVSIIISLLSLSLLFLVRIFIEFDIFVYIELIILSFFIAVNQLIYSLLNSYKKYLNMGISRIIIPTLFSLFGIIIFPYLLQINSSSELIISQILGYLISLILMILFSKAIILEVLYANINEKILNTLYRYKEYPIYSAPHTLLDLIVNNFVFWFITYIYGAHYLGLFSFTFRLLKAPLSIIGASLSQSYIKELSIDVETKSFGLIRRKYLKMITRLTLFSLMTFLPILFLGDDIFKLLFGDSWSESGKIASILSVWLIINFIGSPIVASYLVFKKQKVAFRFSISQNILLILAMLICYLLKTSFYKFLLIYTLVNLFNNVVFYAWITNLILKKR